MGARVSRQHVDVAIVGGGPAGAATGLALSRLGVSTMLIDRGDNGPRIGETLPPAIKNPLSSLGVWDMFISAQHLPSFGTRAIWGQSQAQHNEFIFSPYGPGWHVDRARFDAMLSRAAERCGVRIYRSTELAAIVAGVGDGWELDLTQRKRQRRVRAKLVVDATGRSAVLARRFAGRRIICDRLVGVVGFFAAARAAAQQLTLIEAGADGWWYSALLPGSGAVAVYMTDADLYAQANRRGQDYWRRAFGNTAVIQSGLDLRTLKSQPVVVAAHSSRSRFAAGANWLAVGDAAVAYDPLSSQGIYRALQSGLRSADAIRRYLDGDRAALQEYASSIEHEFAEYLRLRRQYYSYVRRWPDSTFWKRRQSC